MKDQPKIKRIFKHLFEQENKPDEESADDSFETDDTNSEDTSSDDDKPTDDSADNSDDENDKPDVSEEDKDNLDDSIDTEIESVLIDYETDARKSAAIEDNKFGESLKKVYKKKLWESAAEDIDIKRFAGDVARLVKNYDNLLDMKSIILNKSYSFINGKYGDATVKALKDVLEQDFDIEIERNDVDRDVPEIPIAVGARDPQGA